MSHKTPNRNDLGGFLYLDAALDPKALEAALGREASPGLVAELSDLTGWLKAEEKAGPMHTPPGQIRVAVGWLRRAAVAGDADRVRALVPETDCQSLDLVTAWLRHRMGRGVNLRGELSAAELAALVGACDDTLTRLPLGRGRHGDTGRYFFVRGVSAALQRHGYAHERQALVSVLAVLLPVAGVNFGSSDRTKTQSDRERGIWKLVERTGEHLAIG